MTEVFGKDLVCDIGRTRPKNMSQILTAGLPNTTPEPTEFLGRYMRNFGEEDYATLETRDDIFRTFRRDLRSKLLTSDMLKVAEDEAVREMELAKAVKIIQPSDDHAVITEPKLIEAIQMEFNVRFWCPFDPRDLSLYTAYGYGSYLFRLPLEQCGKDFDCTEALLRATTKEKMLHVLDILLDHGGDHFEIVSRFLMEAAEGGRLMSFVFDRKNSEVVITEETLIKAAEKHAVEVFDALFRRETIAFPVTTPVLIAAADTYRVQMMVYDFLRAQSGLKCMLDIIRRERYGEIIVALKELGIRDPDQHWRVVRLLYDARDWENDVSFLAP
ncbi:hypothetical protein QBC36DRAFT_306996 [Triangularia setosa]|uniref:Uncharacterized protein n=1 Tax=Triangularia setosa TaxID=2587417 RepID=A0AAN6WFJ2_9PEZI|nr:hypothetical protein QBC36DRAFT_306996 [Podospora setosa]